jgi:hypothetical protein
VSGALVFGIGTRDNNALGGATVIPRDSNGDFLTKYPSNGSYAVSFLDSSSNAIYLPTVLLRAFPPALARMSLGKQSGSLVNGKENAGPCPEELLLLSSCRRRASQRVQGDASSWGSKLPNTLDDEAHTGG